MSSRDVDKPQPPPADEAEAGVMQHIASRNIGIIISGFGRNSVPTSLERAVVKAIAEHSASGRCGASSTGPRAVLLVVTRNKRALDLRHLIRTLDDVRVAIVGSSSRPPPNESHNSAIGKMFRNNDVIISQDGIILDELRSGSLSLSHLSMLMFDEAEKGYMRSHNFAIIMREFYRGLPKSQKPRVLAISTVPGDIRLTAPIENNLHVEFLDKNRKGPFLRCEETFKEEKPDSVIADVECMHYKFYQNQKLGRSGASELSDYDVLINELGSRAVVSYSNFLNRRSLSLVYRDNLLNEKPNKTSGNLTLHGLTPKVISLLHILRKAYEASTTTDRLMAVVHAGRPVVAVALHAIVSDMTCFDGMLCRVILGDENSARPLENCADGEQTGWQGSDADNEAVDDFGSGDANVLIVASSNIDRITRFRRPIPPCPLVIRFDGSLVDPDNDGGGGRCRVILFKGQKVYAGSLKGNRPKRRREDHAPVVVEQEGAEELPRSSDSNRKLPVMSNATTRPSQEPVKHAKAVGTPLPLDKLIGGTSHDHASSEADADAHGSILPVTDKSAKKRKISSDAGDKQRDIEVREDTATDQAKREDDSTISGAPIANRVPTASALVGPQGGGSDECYLYGLALQSANDSGSEGGMSYNPDGIEGYGMILSRKLRPRDLNISVGDLGLVPNMDDNVGKLQLISLGKIELSTTQIDLVRHFTCFAFSCLLNGVSPVSFAWGKHLKETSQGGKSRIGASFLRNYLIVPVIREHTSDVGNASNSRSVSRQLYSHRINWDHISAIALRPRDKAGQLYPHPAQTPMPGAELEDHMETLKSNLVHVINGKGMLLAGDLRRDLSPLSQFMRQKLFDLNEDGTIKPDKDIAKLTNVDERSDEEGLTEKCHLFKNSDKNVGGKRVTFSAFRNRKVRRHLKGGWAGHFLQSHVEFQKDVHGIDIKTLDQPLITAIVPPRLTIESILDILRGTPQKKFISNFVRAEKKTFNFVPELCRVHPLSVGAVFLPPWLMILERHVLLCELRDLFADGIGVPIPLKLLGQAVTSSGVDPSCNYERLEFLGDSVLKLSSTLRIFTTCPHATEGTMEQKRGFVISNLALKNCAGTYELEKFICFEKLNVNKWKPPGCDREGRVVILNNKSLADVLEALCGVMYLSGCEDYNRERKHSIYAMSSDSDEVDNVHAPRLSIGAIQRGYKVGVQILELLGVVRGREPTQKEALFSAIYSLQAKKSPFPTSSDDFPYDPRLCPEEPWEEQFGSLEELLGYKFKRRNLLLCALTHESYKDPGFESKTMSNTFQRMEFLGDAVIDFFVVVYLYETYPLLTPGELTDLKMLVVSNETFARVSVEFGLHQYLFIQKNSLIEAITRFERVVKERPLEDYELMEEAATCAAPKVLGDVFEAILGAIFIDAGMKEVWNVAMKLLGETLTKRANPENALLHPTRKLHKFVTKTLGITQTPPSYEHRKLSKGVDKYECSSKIVGHVIAVEKANSKKRAQCLSAKSAYERLSNAKPGSDDAKLIDDLRVKAAASAAHISRNVK